MGRRSIVAAFSIFVHAAVLILLMTADFWRPTTEGWPTPRQATAFSNDTPRPVHVEDIELPKPQATRAPRASNDASPQLTSATPIELAPIVVPSGVANETGGESALTGTRRMRDIESNGPGGVGPIGQPSTPPTPPPAPTLVRVGGVIRAPQRIVNVAPVYPAIAREAHAQGLVIIEATIDERGNVTRAQILKSIPLLDDAALTAVRQWKFSPTLLNGVAVPIVMTVTVNFSLTP
jgi:periplasmic protein TonB